MKKYKKKNSTARSRWYRAAHADLVAVVINDNDRDLVISQAKDMGVSPRPFHAAFAAVCQRFMKRGENASATPSTSQAPEHGTVFHETPQGASASESSPPAPVEQGGAFHETRPALEADEVQGGGQADTKDGAPNGGRQPLSGVPDDTVPSEASGWQVENGGLISTCLHGTAFWVRIESAGRERRAQIAGILTVLGFVDAGGDIWSIRGLSEAQQIILPAKLIIRLENSISECQPNLPQTPHGQF